MTDPKEQALAQHLNPNKENIDLEIQPSEYDDCGFEAEGGEYLVLTDDEADEKWEESLDNYIDECILPELEGPLASCFDVDKWKQYAKFDGRGAWLASYDGHEHYENVDGTTFYIYRVKLKEVSS